MKKGFISLGCAVFLFTILFLSIDSSNKRWISSNLEDYPELTLAERPHWAQWRSEGNGVVLFFRHLMDYKKKSEKMVLNSFPGQRAFFATQKQLLANLPQPSESQAYVRVGFVGDLMTVSNPNEKFIAPEILTTLQGMDFVLGNLETPMSQSSAISKFRDFLSQFNVPSSYLNALSINGKSVFQFLSLANNHILDRGDWGVQETIQTVEAKGILVHGADQKKFAFFSSKGIRFGVVAATWGVNPQAFQGKVTSPIWYLKGIASLDKTKIDLAQLRDSLAEMKKNGLILKSCFYTWALNLKRFLSL